MSWPDQEILRSSLILNIIKRMFKEAFKKGSRGVAFELSKILVQDWGFELKDIESNTYIWHGFEDSNVPVNWSMFFRSCIPNSQLKIIKNEVHLILFKYAEEIFWSIKGEKELSAPVSLDDRS